MFTACSLLYDEFSWCSFVGIVSLYNYLIRIENLVITYQLFSPIFVRDSINLFPFSEISAQVIFYCVVSSILSCNFIHL